MFEDYIGDKLQTTKSLRNLNEDYLFEMASISPQISGLPYKIWLDPRGKDRNNEHSNTPRLKVEVNNTLIPVLISDDPEIPQSAKNNGAKDFPGIKRIKNYIIAYKKVLEAHFFNKIRDDELLKIVGPIEDAPKALEKLEDLLIPKNNSYIRYYWDEDECIYYIEVIDEDENLVETHFAINDYELHSQLEELKAALDISKVIKK